MKNENDRRLYRIKEPPGQNLQMERMKSMIMGAELNAVGHLPELEDI